MFPKAYHTDLDLELPDLDGTRSLYVAIYDAEHPDRCEIQHDTRLFFPSVATCIIVRRPWRDPSHDRA